MAFIVIHKRQIKGDTVGVVGSRHKTRKQADAQVYNNTSFIIEMAICPTTQPGTVVNYEACKEMSI